MDSVSELSTPHVSFRNSWIMNRRMVWYNNAKGHELGKGHQISRISFHLALLTSYCFPALPHKILWIGTAIDWGRVKSSADELVVCMRCSHIEIILDQLVNHHWPSSKCSYPMSVPELALLLSGALVPTRIWELTSETLTQQLALLLAPWSICALIYQYIDHLVAKYLKYYPWLKVSF